MTSLTTLEFASALLADGERHWLYGHPYRTEPRRAYIGVRRPEPRAPRRVSLGARVRAAFRPAGRRRLAA